jgi:hypothetical protein
MKSRSNFEAEVLRACLDYLAVRGIFAWRNNSGAVPLEGGRFIRFGYKGSPDILGILPGGKMLCIECKSARGKLSEEQKNFKVRVEKSGGIYIIARGIEDLEEAGL